MKIIISAKFRTLLSAAVIAALFFTACAGESEQESEKNGQAELSALSVASVTAPIPSAITSSRWDNENFNPDNLEARYTGTIEFDDEAAFSGAAIAPIVSNRANVKYAVMDNGTLRPDDAAFINTSQAASFSLGGCLYIKVTSENGEQINYYRFYIELSDEARSKTPVTGIALENEELTLTLFAKGKLKFTITPYNASKRVTWSSSAPDVVSVASDGTVTALRFTTGTNSTNSAEATGTAVITVTTATGNFTDSVIITTTLAGQTDMMTLPPIKDQFSGRFMMGNIANNSVINAAAADGKINDARLIRHYNILTAENYMKPSYLSSGRDAVTGEISYMFTTPVTNAQGVVTRQPIDNFVNSTRAAGFLIHGHVLLWHSQNAAWMNNLMNDDSLTKEGMIAIMRRYITDVMTHYKGKIYSWDVLNEAFPDGLNATANWKTSIRTGGPNTGNPWFVKIGSDFVYEGFLAARLADPTAILYYNDYNTDNANKARVIANMVRDVNDRYKDEYPNDRRLLIEGIGMQEHHNTGITPAAIKATLELFKNLGVKISVSELDVLSQTYSQYDSSTPPTNQGKLDAANRYGEYFKLYLEYGDIIERVTLWGVFDSQSWRSRGLPLLFEGRFPDTGAYFAKPAYYKMIGALEQ